MNRDLKLIKKKYGEQMMHLCRELFPTLLEQDGLLSNLLQSHFKESKSLYVDIIENDMVKDFKDFIFGLVNLKTTKEKKINHKSPKELLEEVGYRLYECKTEEEIQMFRKYYQSNEELCTFNSGRLENNYVFFAVKKNVDDIKRENFKNPKREDEYGTSVISIQFTRDDTHTLSIKNRYNHLVNNPDSTFSNNLDNIVEGLTESFAKYYGMVQKYSNNDFEMPRYVKANDGKYYKYNYEINNIYYCENNVIIDNFEVKEYPKEQYIIFDYYIMDLKQKKVYLYDENIQDDFPNTFKDIDRVEIKGGKEKEIIITDTFGNDSIRLKLDQNNRLISFVNEQVEVIGDGFLYWDETLTDLTLPNVIEIDDDFLKMNEILEELYLPNVKKIGNYFLYKNTMLVSLILPNVIEIGICFLFSNVMLKNLSLPNVIEIDDSFLYMNQILEEVYLPKVKIIGYYFLSMNRKLKILILPKAIEIGDNFLSENQILEELSLPSVIEIGNYFLPTNSRLKKLTLLNAKIIGEYFLHTNQILEELYLPKTIEIGYGFLQFNENLNHISIPLLPETEARLKEEKTKKKVLAYLH